MLGKLIYWLCHLHCRVHLVYHYSVKINNRSVNLHSRTKVIYPEYVKARADDEVSLGSSDEEQTEDEIAANDPDYCPTFWDRDDYVPRAKTKKKKTQSVQNPRRVQGVSTEKYKMVQGGNKCDYNFKYHPVLVMNIIKNNLGLNVFLA